MLDAKECRRIKNECTKNNPGKKLIVDVSKYPFTYAIITHGDGKSWGYFFNYKEWLYLGRNNAPMRYINFKYGEKSLSSSCSLEVISNNPEVQRVYKVVFQYQFLDYVNYYYYYNNLGRGNDLKDLLICNPILITNLIDSDCLRTSYDKYEYLGKLNCLCGHDFIDLTKPLIKDAFHLPVNWINTYLSFRDYNKIIYLKSHNYTPKEITSTLFRLPEKYLSNKKTAIRMAKSYTYRDYVIMREELPDNVKKNFPMYPEDIDKYHNKIVPIYNRQLALSQEEKLKEKQKKYEENVYKEAVKFNYSDENFSIIACEKLTDLIVEGNTLNHCVGSYTDSVSEGREYILFLRKNSDIETPYFTIDLTPSKHVRQIHGKCNCNINDEIRPFVEEWAKKFKLDLTNCSGVYCALRWNQIARMAVDVSKLVRLIN